MKSIILVATIISTNVFADDCHDYYFSRNFESALQFCQDKAGSSVIKDNWEAPLILGNMYQRGYGVAANFDHAVYWYEKSASIGNCTAMMELQIIYSEACHSQSYGCNGAKLAYWSDNLTNSCSGVNPVFMSNNARYYSLASQGRSQDFLR